MPKEKIDDLGLSGWQYAAAASMSAIPDFLVKHGPDTLIKRLQTYPERIFSSDIVKSWRTLRHATSPGHRYSGFIPFVETAFQGASWGFANKLAQRTVTYSTHFYVNKYLNLYLGEGYNTTTAHVAKSVVAGGAAGLSELPIYPFDTMKVRFQTDRASIKGNSVHYFFRNFPTLYKGVEAAALRNIFGSSLFFGGAELAKQWCDAYSIEGTKKAAIASWFATILRIIGPYPFDTIKTNIQKSGNSGLITNARNLMKNGGIRAFYRGIGGKLLSQFPPQFVGYFTFLCIISIFQEKASQETGAPEAPLARQSIFSRLGLDSKLESSTKVPGDFLAPRSLFEKPHTEQYQTETEKQQTRRARP